MVEVRSMRMVRRVDVRIVAVRRRPRPAIGAVGVEAACQILGSESAVVTVIVIGIVACV